MNDDYSAISSIMTGDCTVGEVKSLLGLSKGFTVPMLDQVITYLFSDSRGTSTGGKKSYDHIKDYRYIVPSFMQLYGINLERDTLTWFEYMTMLEGCFMSDCLIREVVRIRQMELPKDSKAKVAAIDLKAKYRLTENDQDLGSMFKTLKGVSKRG